MSNDEQEKGFDALLVKEIAPGQFDREITQRTLAELGTGEVLIKVYYSSLNYKDALSAYGNRGVTRSYPHTPGIDAAGVVIESSVGDFTPGDQVVVTGYDLGMNTSGGLGQYIRVPSAWVIPLPVGLSLRDCMVIGTAGMTAALSIEKLQKLGAKPEDGSVLVTGATGGVGSFSIALLKLLGFSVVACTRKLECAEMLTKLGAHQIIDRTMLEEQVTKPLLRPQWAHAVDTVGGELLFNVVKSIEYGGNVTCCGMVASPNFTANVFPFILRGVNLLGIDSVELPLPKKLSIWNRLAGDLKLPQLSSMAQEIDLPQVPMYLDQLYRGKAVGRYLVNMQ